VGRLVAEKGFDSVLPAFATVLNRFPTARLVIAGDGPERQRLIQQTIELGLGSSVEFLGSVPPETVPHLINAATLVVIPSKSEGFGLVALEAALMARPVVAMRVGGLPEVVLDQKTGLLVEPDDQEGLAKAILLLLSHPQAAAAFGEAGRSRAKEIFSFERYVAAYDDLYQSLRTNAQRRDGVRL
jgi:glycogen(starch) synthase